MLDQMIDKIPDKLYIELKYFKHFKKIPNLNNPSTFNEKMQWLKLYNRKPEHTMMVDKYLVKNYVSKIIGDEYIIPTLGVWEDAKDINFDLLPNQFVLKWNHDSGSIIICKDKSKFNVEEAVNKLDKFKSHNGFRYGREWPYKNVHPYIIAEQYMEDKKTKELRDYKFFCFHGEVKCFKVDFDRFTNHRANYYDNNMNLLNFGEKNLPPDYKKKIKMPDNIKKMINLAKKLSYGEIFLRVDFYEVNGHIYFGELTFYPASGFGPFTSKEWDEKLGSWIMLPKNNV